MKSFIASMLITLALSAIGYAEDDCSLSRRGVELCDQYATASTDKFLIYNNLWNKDKDPNGKQCTTLNWSNGNAISWHTSYSWAGWANNEVKSYASVALKFTPQVLRTVRSIETAWSWYTSTSNMVADVSYDMFLASSPDGHEEIEVIVWLASFGGAGPISSTGKSIATVWISGHEWDLWVGPNGKMTVYSFVARSTITNFGGNMLDFFNHLVYNHGVDNNKYLKTIQAGPEPFTGTAKMTVDNYWIELH
ncbi:hypothetical protein LT330_004143 [Penicillium expansum]|nr:hypothetical protein LT330_004143 [Penicillium expansum]